MRVWTEVVIDIESGKVSRGTFFTYSGPLALCDRSLVNTDKNAAKTAEQTAGNFQANAGQIEGNLVPRLEQQAVNPTGYGAFGLGDMETQAEQSAGAASGAASEAMKLRAMRTGNAAGVGAGQVAAAGETARAGGSALQSILAKNAELKATQQNQANQQLGGILGENIHGDISAQGLVPEDINAATNASKVGWLQDVEGLGGTTADLIKAIKGGK